MKNCMVSNYLQRDGFVMVSNLLIAYQEELELTDRELIFIIKCIKHKENYKLHDNQLDPSVSSRTLQRCRKSLKDKGYLQYKVWKYTDEKGHISTEGITYDFSGLEEKLQTISNIIAEEKNKLIEEESENYILEFGEDSPISRYIRDWENHYGDVYKLSAFERSWYNKLSEEEQKAVGMIFDYCLEYRLFKEITPRLSLFIKTPQRWKALKEYAEDNQEENIITYKDIEEATFEKKSEKNEVEEKENEEALKRIREEKRQRKIERTRKEIEDAKEKLKTLEFDDINVIILEGFVQDKLEELKELTGEA